MSPKVEAAATKPKFAFLPAIDTPKYYLLLACVSIFVLGPLGAIAAAYMNFSLGFFVGGQVLAGILGSAVTYGYGPEGKHGANYMQTMAASVASLSAMAVLIQAMVWLGMPMPPAWQLVVFYTCIGMFGVGVGMLYTPILVDRLQLEYPSGHAVANILRALTDKRLLKRSIGQLGSGTGLGIAFAWMAEKLPRVAATQISASTIGAGMVVGSRIAVPGLVMGLLGHQLTPWLRSIGWLGPQDPFRKVGFLIALAMILGAALVDLTLIGFQAVARIRKQVGKVTERAQEEAWKQVKTGRLIAWVVFWGVALVVVATQVLHQPVGFIVFAIFLTMIFVCINGITTGISDSNPISSAFVIAVLLMSALGLKDPTVGLMAASILLVACSSGVDMQQDRSTGWRLGTNRVIQFRYQVIGIVVGAIMAVILANTFMKAYPVLKIDTFAHPEAKVDQWQSAMTFKFVGALRDLGHLPTYKVKALVIGLSVGLCTEILRKLVHASKRYKRFTEGSKVGFGVGWTLDAVVLPSPYASSFGGFVEWMVTLWFAAGGVLSSALNSLPKPAKKPKMPGPIEGVAPAGHPDEEEMDDELPEDMSTTSLVGGGLIAGESIFALAVGVIGLLKLVT
jgi:uncharacterized oligopeptide transporter (OPT) family protein